MIPVDSSKFALSGAAYPPSELGVVKVVTRQKSEYIFPDMPKQVVRSVIPESGRIPADQPALVMLNASQAVLTLPLRVVGEIYIDEELVWTCPA